MQLVLLAALVAGALAVVEIYDETLWTKQLWAKWKLDSSMFSLTPTDENPMLLGTSAHASDILEALQNSLDGPGLRLTPQTSRADMLDAEALDDQSLLGPASQAVRCSVCHTLVSRVWQRVVVELLKGTLSTTTAPTLLPRFFTEACATEVVSLLHRTTIYRMEVENELQSMTFFVMRRRRTGTSPTHAEKMAVGMACKEVLLSGRPELVALVSANLQTFKEGLDTLLRKHGITPAMAGIDAGAGASASRAEGADLGAGEAGGAGPTLPMPKRALEEVARLLGGDAGAGDAARGQGEGAALAGIQQPAVAAGDAGQQQLGQLVERLLKGLAAQLKQEGVTVQGLEDEGADEDDDDPYLDPDDEEDEEESECLDLHPLCEQWANEGECEANPKYMVGTDTLKGHCRKACGLCSPNRLSSTELLNSHPALAKDVQALSNGMLQAMKGQGCSAKQGCLTSASGVAVQGAVVASKGIDLNHVATQGGFVLGKPLFGMPELRETGASKAVLARQQQQAQAKLQAGGPVGGDGDGDEDAASAGSGDLQREVETALLPELGGRLLHLRTEFFTYEYLFRNHTRHFHEEPPLHNKPGKLTEDWMLGTFVRESLRVEAAAGGNTAMLHAKDLLPDQQDLPSMAVQSWPYIKQVYANGDLCLLGGGRRVVRRTEVRLACSPNGKLHLLVREPDFCHYIFVIYSPRLCGVPHFAPRPEPTPHAE